MSIDARVRYVHVHEDGSGELHLEDRPGNPPGIAGQRVLAYVEAPEEVTALNGLDIWGGSDGIMLGEVEIAKRRSYTWIEFVGRDQFVEAVKKYHERRKANAENEH